MKKTEWFIATDLNGEPLTNRFYHTPTDAKIAAKNKYKKDEEFKILTVAPISDVAHLCKDEVGAE